MSDPVDPEGRTEADVPEAYYFGCWRSVGHAFYAPDMGYVPLQPPSPWGWDVEYLTSTLDKTQGVAALRHKDGWTALAVHDYTIDHRGNSKSVFVFAEQLTYTEALMLARNLFPAICDRLDAAGGIRREVIP